LGRRYLVGNTVFLISFARQLLTDHRDRADVHGQPSDR
jgi:hypothetical protein